MLNDFAMFLVGGVRRGAELVGVAKPEQARGVPLPDPNSTAEARHLLRAPQVRYEGRRMHPSDKQQCAPKDPYRTRPTCAAPQRAAG